MKVTFRSGLLLLLATTGASACTAILGGFEFGATSAGTGGSGGSTTGTTASSTTSTSSTATSTTSTSGATGTGGSTGLKTNGTACTAGSQCSSGACVDDGQGGTVCCATSCTGNFACGASGTCNTTCSGKADCAATATCSAGVDAGGGTCLLTNGQKCMQGSACASTYCADGVCCNIACNNTPCYACSAVLTGGKDGTCATVADGTLDPRGLCNIDTNTCNGDGTCLGGLCNPKTPTGTICGSKGCLSNGVVSTSEELLLCSDAGQCDQIGATISCPANACAGYPDACGCATGADCPAQLPYCFPNLDCMPPCGTGKKCCNVGGCMPDTTTCNTGSCSSVPYK